MQQELIIIVSTIAGALIGWFLSALISNNSIKKAKQKAIEIKSDAAEEIEDLKSDLKLKSAEELDLLKQELENEYINRTRDLKAFELKVSEEEALVEKRNNEIDNLEKMLETEKVDVKLEMQKAVDMRTFYRSEVDKVNQKLEQISGMTKEEALEELQENLISEAHKNSSKIIQEIIDDATVTGQTKSKDIILQSIFETAADHTAESTVSIVKLPDDSMKGRIIGREGRNIRSFELKSGVDVLIDDTPDTIVLSCFDPIRREVAKIALERLIEDGRIHPGRIEEVLEKVKSESDDRDFEAGEQALFDLGIHNIHGDLTSLIGKLRFYTVSGQNVLKHSVEVAKLAAQIATHLELDTSVAKRASIFHELGRVVNKPELSISERTLELLRKYKEIPKIIEIIENIKAKYEVKHQLIYVINAAKSISMARPGARREIFESYLKRLTKLEELCNNFEGVKKSYAIQTGREVRVLVDCDIVEDHDSHALANEIANKIETNTEYPGQVKVSIYREFRSIDFAK